MCQNETIILSYCKQNEYSSTVDGLPLRLTHIPNLVIEVQKWTIESHMQKWKLLWYCHGHWSAECVFYEHTNEFLSCPRIAELYIYKPGLSRAKFCVISWGLLLVLSKIVRSFHLDYTELRILRISSGCQLVYQESWKQDFVGCKAKIRYRAHPYDGSRIMFRLFVLSTQRISKQGSLCCFPFPIYNKGRFQDFHFPSDANGHPLSVGLL